MKPALILHGPPGSGKTTWIQREAQRLGYKLFCWNVRNDRSLREGREVLHSQVRSQEKTLIWIEGADDLTQEAQAFLRRILDTRSTEVQCILETREPWKLSAPVLSRCSFVRAPHSSSFRRQLLEGKARECGIVDLPEGWKVPQSEEELIDYRRRGADPRGLLLALVQEPGHEKEKREALRRMGAGCSPWLQMAWLLTLRDVKTAASE